MKTMSIWQQNVTLPAFPRLSGNETVHTAIIGGGLTGLLTAHLLSQRGIRALVLESGRIDCSFTRCDAYLYSQTESTPLEQEAQIANSFGVAAEFTRESELPFQIAGAVWFANQARFHPLKFIQAIVDGLDIRENTRVISVEDDRIHTEHGTVTAEHIFFASHYPFVNVPGWYFVRMMPGIPTWAVKPSCCP